MTDTPANYKAAFELFMVALTGQINANFGCDVTGGLLLPEPGDVGYHDRVAALTGYVKKPYRAVLDLAPHNPFFPTSEVVNEAIKGRLVQALTWELKQSGLAPEEAVEQGFLSDLLAAFLVLGESRSAPHFLDVAVGSLQPSPDTDTALWGLATRAADECLQLVEADLNLYLKSDITYRYACEALRENLWRTFDSVVDKLKVDPHFKGCTTADLAAYVYCAMEQQFIPAIVEGNSNSETHFPDGLYADAVLDALRVIATDRGAALDG